MWGVKSRINLCNLVAQSPLLLCNSTLNSQICKTKLKFSLHIRTTWILDLPGHQTNFKHFINIMWEPVRNPARGYDHLLSLNSLCLPTLIMLNSKEYTAFHEWQIPLCSIRQAANKYRSPTFWYPHSSCPVATNISSLRKHAYSNIQKILPLKNENCQIRIFDIFHISAQNIDCEYSLEPPRRGGSNEYPQSIFLAEISKIMYTPVNPSFTI